MMRVRGILVQLSEAIKVGVETLAVLCQLLTQGLPCMPPQYTGLVIPHGCAVAVEVVDVAIAIDVKSNGKRLALY